MQKITRCIDDLGAKGTPIHLYWIPAYTEIRGNGEADVAATEQKGGEEQKGGAESGENRIPDIQQKDMC